MADININLTKIYDYIKVLTPLVAMLVTSWFWFDTRYMHKEISDMRFIELQIRIVEGHISFYNRIIDDGLALSAQDAIKYEMEKDQLKKLMEERNKTLRIGDLPE